MADACVRVFVGGDICPIGRMADAFASGACDQAFGDVLALIRGCDFAVANLECPLGDSDLRPIAKSGPNLRGPAGAAETLRRSGFGAVGLANNHIMDFGKAGLESTRAACAAAGLGTFGAGADVQEARKLHIVTLKGIRIAFLAIAEDERCLATATQAGANPVDPIWVVRTLTEHRGQFDRLIVLLHGGNEGFAYPSPWLREQCRFLVEQGADVVVCQHSHCVGSLETHQGGTILYGQGNFIFDYADHGALGGQGLGMVVAFRPGEPAEVVFHPIEQAPGADGVRLCGKRDADAVLKRLDAQSEVLGDPERYAQVWGSYCEARQAGFLTRLFGFGTWLRRLNRREWMFRRLTQPELLRIYNLVSCESHRSALRASLDSLIDRRTPPQGGPG